ncbi:MAG TPA: ABC transporter permease [Chthoniobacterales bacterium]
MPNFFGELRHAARLLGKNPGFTAIAALTLALGIGANTAIFSVVNALLLRPLPYPHSEQLVLLRERSDVFESGSVSYPNYLDWRAAQRGFTDLALFRRGAVNVPGTTGESAPERIGCGRVSANYFGILGVGPKFGRDFMEADDLPNSNKVALITDALWHRRFGGSPAAIGQKVLIDGVSREIIGVLPAIIRLPRLCEIYLPLDEVRAEEGVLLRGNHPGFSALGRLKPGVTLEQARADLNNIAMELERRYPDDDAGRRVNARILLESAVADYRQGVWLLFAATGCVLLIACANVANLQLSRALARSRELAVRAALGASRWQLVRQLMMESSLLVFLGAVAGVLFSLWSLDAILALTPATVPRFQETRIDWVALAFTTGIAVIAGLVVGLWPALRISRQASLSLDLHEGGERGSSGGLHRQRARSMLVVSQVALALVLLAAAGLTLQSFWHAQRAPLGFDPSNILSLQISLPKARYDKDEKVTAFNAQLLEKVRAIPGVSAAATGVNVPFDDTEWDSYFHLTGTPTPPPGKEPSAEVNIVSADYFRVMGMPIVRGRGFGPQDVAGQPRSVIIDESFVRRYFPGKDPIGQKIDDNQTLKKDPPPPPLTVVGVVPRTRNEAPGENNVEKLNFVQMYFYEPQYAQEQNSLLIRVSSGDPLAFVGAVKRAIEAIDPDQPVGVISTMEKNVAASLATRRLLMVLLATFASLALVLASVGLYGVMALNVAQRMRELGIRMALGAARADVFRLVLGQGMFLIAVGLALGLAGAAAASRALTSVLYGVGTLDLPAFAVAVVSLALVALLACILPARRATQVDPIIALRAE